MVTVQHAARWIASVRTDSKDPRPREARSTQLETVRSLLRILDLMIIVNAHGHVYVYSRSILALAHAHSKPQALRSNQSPPIHQSALTSESPYVSHLNLNFLCFFLSSDGTSHSLFCLPSSRRVPRLRHTARPSTLQLYNSTILTPPGRYRYYGVSHHRPSRDLQTDPDSWTPVLD
jgi:hypothetical protein